MLVKIKGTPTTVANELMKSPMLIIANDWQSEIVGDVIPVIMKIPTEELDHEDIIQRALDRGADGVIFGGLDWTLQPVELVELISSAVDNGLKILIMSRLDLEEFDSLIGKSLIGHIGYEKLYKDTVTMGTEDDDVFMFIGRTILDYVIGEEYYMLCGLHNAKFYAFKPKEGDDENDEFTEKAERVEPISNN